jgi:hypothetical protein
MRILPLYASGRRGRQVSVLEFDDQDLMAVAFDELNLVL